MNSLNGTMISNNQLLCFDPSQEWVRRADTLLEYNLASVRRLNFLKLYLNLYSLTQCPETTCPMYEVGGLCTSVCSTCGTLCEAFPITDLASLQLYKTKGCTTVVGDLYIMDLPVTVTKKLLFDNLKSVQYIRGGLYVKDNPFLSALTFLSNLVGVYGVYLSNLPLIVDARMPSLTQFRDGISVDGCDRLCPARYTMIGAGPSDIGCANPTMNYFFRVVGDFKLSDIALLDAVVARVVTNVTNGAVCIFLCL